MAFEEEWYALLILFFHMAQKRVKFFQMSKRNALHFLENNKKQN